MEDYMTDLELVVNSVPPEIGVSILLAQSFMWLSIFGVGFYVLILLISLVWEEY